VSFLLDFLILLLVLGSLLPVLVGGPPPLPPPLWLPGLMEGDLELRLAAFFGGLLSSSFILF
jgi:hypothetical protein